MLVIHKKSGKKYIIFSPGIDSTNIRDGTRVVIYSPINNPLKFYVREEKEFWLKYTKELTYYYESNT